MELYYELFEKLKEENTSMIDRHNFISKVGGQNIDWNAHFEALTKLAEKKLIRVEGNSRHIIVLLPNFYDAISEGGIDAWEKARRAEKELNTRLIESSIRTNLISKRTTIISTFVALVTLIVLLFDTCQNN